MKRFILLLVILGVGFYLVLNRTPSPEDVDPYESEEYSESNEEEPPQPQQAVTSPTPPPPPPPPLATAAPAKKEQPQSDVQKQVAKVSEEKRAKDMVKAIKNFTPDELREVQAYYKELERKWVNIVQDILVENYPEYQSMKKAFQQERQESFRKFHISMMEEYGKDHVYSPTEYENQVGRAIQEKYFKKFEEKFGSQSYNRYMENLQQFNREVKRHQDPSKGLLQIFF